VVFPEYGIPTIPMSFTRSTLAGHVHVKMRSLSSEPPLHRSVALGWVLFADACERQTRWRS
jgi:hypothetical protein